MRNIDDKDKLKTTWRSYYTFIFYFQLSEFISCCISFVLYREPFLLNRTMKLREIFFSVYDIYIFIARYFSSVLSKN